MIMGTPSPRLAPPTPRDPTSASFRAEPVPHEVIAPGGTSAALSLPVSDLRRNLRDLHDDESGAAFVEYVVVLLLIGTVASIATYSLGRPFVDYYRFAQLIVSMPFP